MLHRIETLVLILSLLQTCRAVARPALSCSLNCNTGVCKILPGQGERCVCPPQFSGPKCENFRCSQFCRNKGQCYVDLLAAKTPDTQPVPRCNCPPQWTGERCETPVNMCEGRCYNGGTCYTVTAGEPQCSCKLGFAGSRCQDCSKLQCKNGGVCVRNDNKESCQCSAGYQGKNCEKSDCDNFCMNFGTCILTPTGPWCTCAPGFAGIRCEQDACFQHCRNGGTCRIGTKQPECQCPPFYSGRRCEIDLCSSKNPPPECANVKQCGCLNNGTCEVRSGFEVCKCPNLWGGSKCDVSFTIVFEEFVFKKIFFRSI